MNYFEKTNISISKAVGSFLGLAVGDALGSTLEFTKRTSSSPLHTEILGGGPFKISPGSHTDDTCMAMAMATSLLERNCFDPVHVMDEFLKWYKQGKYSPSGKCDDIGNTVKEALLTWDGDRLTPFCGRTEEYKSGNGGIMRLAPIIIWNRNSSQNALIYAVLQSMLTHSSEYCIQYAKLLASILWHGTLDPKVIEDLQLLDLPKGANWPTAGGDVMSSMKAAVWSIRTTATFEDAVIKAVNLGGDSDTVGAITGQIAGRIYGHEAIPNRWKDTLIAREQIETLASRLYEMAPDVQIVNSDQGFQQ